MDDQFREQVRQANDIVEIIGDYVELKKSGKEYLGLCPFHEDTKPSLNVSPDKQLFHCFVCDAGGDVFQFIEKKESLTFPEALRYLANKAGLEIPREKHLTKKEKKRKESMTYTIIEGKLEKKDTDIRIETKKKNLGQIAIQKLRTDAFLELIPDIKELDAGYLKLTKDWLKENWKIGPDIVSQEIKQRKLETSNFLKEPLEFSKQKFNPRSYSEGILTDESLKFDKYKRFWIFDKSTGIWKNEAELILNSTLRKRILGNPDYKRYCVAEIIADLQGLTYISEEPEEPAPNLIPFRNGIYDLENEKLLKYDPKYFFINKLLVDYNTKYKDCETIDRIFSEIVDASNMATLYEMIAYSLWRGYPYPKIFILYGSGGNGKSAYIKILNKILGKQNISLISAMDLQNNRFASSGLFGKLVNVSGEMEYSILRNTSKLKACTGEDLIYCEKKFKDPFPFENYAKMIFLTNQVPLTRDKTYAFYRRIFLLEFPNKFVLGENADPMIVEKIPKEEFEALAYRCTLTLKGLKKNNFVFANHEKTEEVTKRYEELSNPLSKFIQENTEKEPNSEILVSELSDKFLSYLKENSLRTWTDKEITRGMKDMGYTKKSLMRENRTDRYWLELKWK